MRRGGPGKRKGVEGHSWSQLCPFPIWGAADWGQAQGHAAPSLWLGPGAGSECAQDSMCVFLCELREEVQETHLFLIPQKALLSGPGGAGVSVKDCEGRRGRVSGHTHTACVGYDVVRCGGACFTATSSSTSFHLNLFDTYIFRMWAHSCKCHRIFVLEWRQICSFKSLLDCI